MDVETKEMLQAIIAGMDGLEKRLNENIKEEIRGVKIIIENDVSKRIDSRIFGRQIQRDWCSAPTPPA